MRIDGKGGVTPTTTSSTRKTGASGAGFRLEEQSKSARPSSTSATQAMQSTEALLILQEDDTPKQRKRKFIKRGNDLLSELDQLKAKLLSGHVSPSDLKRLTALLSQRSDSVDQPDMNELMRHIELRAHVELAKLQRS